MMHDYTYSQLIHLDMNCGGLTKKQAVLTRQLDRRWKKAYRNVIEQQRKATCRLERRVIADLCGYHEDLMG